jgi:DNA-binding GntR family transcriptional regulator
MAIQSEGLLIQVVWRTMYVSRAARKMMLEIAPNVQIKPSHQRCRYEIEHYADNTPIMIHYNDHRKDS